MKCNKSAQSDALARAAGLSRYANRMKLIFALIVMVVVNGHAYAITPRQCQALGGKYLAGECYKELDGELLRSDGEVVAPTNDQCEIAGGKMVNGDCVAEVSEMECRRLGGELDQHQGCVKEPTHEECEAAGGVVADDGRCSLQ